MLLDLVPDSVHQGELDLEDDDAKDRFRLMSAEQSIWEKNRARCQQRTGGSPALMGMKQETRTPQYTTRWEEVPIVRA
jgi:DNA polymerase V